MIEAIIGRQHGTNCLLMKIGGKGYPLSDNNTVPNTVSSNHCKLTIDDKGTWRLSNIKDELDTFVDGIQIATKQVTPESHVNLGANRFVVDMHKVETIIMSIAPPVYSLRPLEQVWNKFHDTQLQMQLDEKKKNVNKMASGVLSSLGMIMILFPIALNTEKVNITIPPFINVLRFVIALVSFLLALYFYIQSRRGLNNDIILRIDKLNRDFRRNYLCPNPQCRRFMGNIPFDILSQQTQCPHCHCRYTNT